LFFFCGLIIDFIPKLHPRQHRHRQPGPLEVGGVGLPTLQQTGNRVPWFVRCGPTMSGRVVEPKETLLVFGLPPGGHG